MVVAYLDTSAAMKLVFDETGSDDLESYFIARMPQAVVASWLLHTELHCAANRRGVVPPEALSRALNRVDLADVTRGDLLAAGTLKPLRAQDAIHLATAIRLGADEMVTYDRELADAARAAGLRVVSPGT